MTDVVDGEMTYPIAPAARVLRRSFCVADSSQTKRQSLTPKPAATPARTAGDDETENKKTEGRVAQVRDGAQASASSTPRPQNTLHRSSALSLDSFRRRSGRFVIHLRSKR